MESIIYNLEMNEMNYPVSSNVGVFNWQPMGHMLPFKPSFMTCKVTMKVQFILLKLILLAKKG